MGMLDVAGTFFLVIARNLVAENIRSGAYKLTGVIFLCAGLASPAHANSCSNVTPYSGYYFIDNLQGGLTLDAGGTFRILNEKDEDRQPAFNLAQVSCNSAWLNDRTEAREIECRVTRASVSGAGQTCDLVLDISTFSMKEIGKGVLAGIGGDSTSCYYGTLTIDRNTKRVFLSYTRTVHADRYDKIKPSTCGDAPPQVLMNCTSRVAIRAGKTDPTEHVCDFSGD
jgi:hypothetical protein